MRVCIALYAKAPKVYKEFVDNSEFGLPAVTTIRQERTRNQTKEGYCASIYSNMRANVGDEAISGRLLVDECELKLGIIMNEKIRQVYGVVDDDSYYLKWHLII